MRVALVGYTNAGKSTLMNTLSNAKVLAEDKLFATLDSTTRAIDLSGNRMAMLTDTVGFIRKLPHSLIESFKSTLDEVRESDILLHVIDARHPRSDDLIRVVNQTLRELDSDKKPTLMVFNKVDAIEDKDHLVGLHRHAPDGVFVSALRGIGIDGLRERIDDLVRASYVQRTVLLPVSDARTRAFLHRVGDVLSEDVIASPEETELSHPHVRITVRLARRHVSALNHLDGMVEDPEEHQLERVR
jgi:GTP-binding protein HflX